jgi:hypothetical protein
MMKLKAAFVLSLLVVAASAEGRDTVRVRSKSVCVNGVCGVAGPAKRVEARTKTRTSSRVR